MEKLKTYDFWVKLAAAVILIFTSVSSKFGLSVDSSLFMDIVTGICSCLVVLGIIQAPSNLNKTKKENNMILDNEESQKNDIVCDLPIEETSEVKEEINEETEEEETQENTSDTESKTSTCSCSKEYKEPECFTDNCEGDIEDNSICIKEDTFNSLISRIDYLISKFESLLND